MDFLNFPCTISVGFHGVMVSTQDSESCDPSSNLGGTWLQISFPHLGIQTLLLTFNKSLTFKLAPSHIDFVGKRVTQHRWFSGRMLACHAGGPGSIPGRCKHFSLFSSSNIFSFSPVIWCGWWQKVGNKNFGDGGYRSPYLSHAKRALYHLSYVP